jgi:thiamine pyrophosphate-dependent acetolactate synthase large subunit-like protein
MLKGPHRYVDLLRAIRPIAKWNARLSNRAIIAEVVRRAVDPGGRDVQGPPPL